MDQKRPQLKARVDGDYGEFVLEPLTRGYGVTIGNPIRRILMSSIPGTAVTSVYIEDVLHEFSTIPGVKEDVIQMILNLKELVVKFHASGPKTLTLRAQGEGVVRASAFEVPSDAEIVNPDLVIAHLAEDGKLVMEVRVEEGEGYVPADKHATKDRINSIPVDAMFSPVRRVAYHVENTRVGQQTDLDRLILRVWTDGSVSPQDALDKGVEILRDELTVFGNVETLPAAAPEYQQPVYTPAPAAPNVYDLPPQTSSLNLNPGDYPAEMDSPRVTLEGLGLTTRVLHSLKEEGIDSVDALCALSDRDLKKVPGIGERSLDEIKQQLAQFGLALRD
ncbi:MULTISPECIES: DNA-directed RNA polymerase subunit alpha [Deinococcus]|uniref:DNA-directed RNA polymerase subunit alpha n=1 Tax=Deinococcus caeni TaxID=569127 RepID=A0ABP9UJS3_9DEIO|nr:MULTISPECIES: DNA-directed RNA polymerase subunit alpha [unclassified Deinococcus]MBX8466277.1 DNA-directed RNA polymerase subunit alpha [Deinococcus sp. RIT780]MCD0158265.1 DNA-directed RNA polymerase subunit alpha [Deinococcus sp. 6GRE01]MCD0162740.1 DNA-directed RNA polymerase subunit alpha [Deinococcus sp. 6YEL10]MCD0166266.1 DNA-directed RNA polymerase subunit alpha [Deinococcus sp. 12RED42]MCD0170597.1 DNA-directed RNA polymerase subunit alpha [Deinococcus sp. 23YEL01]MCD0176376.1 DN